MQIDAGTSDSEGIEKKKEVRKLEGKTLREVIVKIRLEKIDTQEGVIVEALLDSGVTRLVMSSEFAKKQGFKLKKLEKPINVRNVDGSFNKKRPIRKYGGDKHLLSGIQGEDRDRHDWWAEMDSDFGNIIASLP